MAILDFFKQFKDKPAYQHDRLKQVLFVLLIGWVSSFREDYRIYQRLVTYANAHHLDASIYPTILSNSIAYGIYSLAVFVGLIFLTFYKKPTKQTLWILVAILTCHPFICYFFENRDMAIVGSNSQSHIEFLKIRLGFSAIVIIGLMLYKNFSNYYKNHYST